MCKLKFCDTITIVKICDLEDNMNKIPENKTRKRLRTAMWVFYLLEIVLCSLPYYQYSMDGKIYSNSVFDMLSALGAGNDIGLPSSEYSAINTMIPLNFIFLVIPIVGFFFCVLDRKSNMKNIVSILCCLLGVVSILTIVTINLISLGSMLALLLYILTSFLTVFSIFARFSAPSDAEKAADIQKK